MDYSKAVQCAILAREIYQDFADLKFGQFAGAHLEIIQDQVSDTQCVILHQPESDHLYIVFRGTESNTDWQTNVKFTRNLFQIRNMAEEMAADPLEDEFTAPPPEEPLGDKDASMGMDFDEDDAFAAPAPSEEGTGESDADMHFEEVDEGGGFVNFMANLMGRRQENHLVTKYPRAQMHNGFVRAMITIQDRLHQYIVAHQPRKLTITGHSLGGALATLCALDMRLTYDGQHEIDLYTFGAPRVGNSDFQALFNESVPNSYRIVNGQDIVPTIPGEFLGYRHVGHEVNLGQRLSRRVSASLVTDHLMPGYIEGLKKLHQLSETGKIT